MGSSTLGRPRALETRLKEHQAATRQGELEKSAIAEHAWTEHHCPAWDDVTILEQARNDDTLRIKEALCISMAEKQMLLNRDRGTTIADCWVPLLQHMHINYQSAAAHAIYRELVVYSYTCVFYCSDEGRSMATETSAFLFFILFFYSFFKVFVVGLMLLLS